MALNLYTSSILPPIYIHGLVPQKVFYCSFSLKTEAVGCCCDPEPRAPFVRSMIRIFFFFFSFWRCQNKSPTRQQQQYYYYLFFFSISPCLSRRSIYLRQPSRSHWKGFSEEWSFGPKTDSHCAIWRRKKGGSPLRKDSMFTAAAAAAGPIMLFLSSFFLIKILAGEQ